MGHPRLMVEVHCLPSQNPGPDGENAALFGRNGGLSGLENGQNPGFAVTDPSLGKNYKLLNVWKLQAMQGSKEGLQRGRGEGVKDGPGTSLTDWAGRSGISLFILPLCAPGGK